MSQEKKDTFLGIKKEHLKWMGIGAIALLGLLIIL